MPMTVPLPPLIISIQSQVVHGHVGNSAAVYPMQAAGLNVAAVPTTLLSNNPHYPTMRGRVLETALVADLLTGVEERGLPDQAFAILTGYMGSAANARAVAGFIARAKARNPSLLTICDPVIGDSDTGIYVAEGIVEAMREALVPQADLITPNQFELGLLAARDLQSLAAVEQARALLARGRKLAVVATGCRLEDTSAGMLETIVLGGDQTLRIASDHVPLRPAGTGDLFTAHLVARLAHGTRLGTAAAEAVDAVNAVLHRTLALGTQEMAIIG